MAGGLLSLLTGRLLLHCCLVQGFASEQCPEGFVAVVRNTLRILAVENIGETFNQSISRLRYTPRRLLVHQELKSLIVAESDYQAVPLADNSELQKRLLVREWVQQNLGCLGAAASRSLPCQPPKCSRWCRGSWGDH